jgi:hypothetical protein
MYVASGVIVVGMVAFVILAASHAGQWVAASAAAFSGAGWVLFGVAGFAYVRAGGRRVK